MTAYSEKLKDPRWQKKRLEILERDEWACQYCDDKESTLHVHHEKYTAKEPWLEPNKNLTTVCHCCHQIVEKYKDGRTIYGLRKFNGEDEVVNIVIVYAHDGKREWVYFEEVYKNESRGIFTIAILCPSKIIDLPSSLTLTIDG